MVVIPGHTLEEQEPEQDDLKIEVVERPLEERLAHGTELHSNVLTKLKDRRDLSLQYVEDRIEEWDRVREHLRMYIDLRRPKRRADRSSDPSTAEMPFVDAVTIPMSYASLHTLLAQWMSIWAARVPEIQLRGANSEDIVGAVLLEAMLAYDAKMMKIYSVQYANTMNALAYGSGLIYDSWEINEGSVTEFEPLSMPGMPPEILRAMLGPLAFTPMRRWGVRSEFNRWQSVDPRRMRPDPRVPMHALQEGEFFGHSFMIGWHNLYKKSGEKGPYFNVEKLRETGNTGRARGMKRNGYDPINPRGGEGFRGTGGNRKEEFYECEAMTIEIIPKEWKLSDVDYPEKWTFAWGEDQVIIRAHEQINKHGMFPYSVTEVDSDFESTFSPGLVELIEPMQRFTNWMFNAHIENVTTMLNNRYIYSPRFFDEASVEYSGPGEHITLTDEAVDMLLSGEIDNVQQFFTQVPVQDVTKSSYMDGVQYIYQMAQLLTGANNPMSGIQLPTERSATEVSTITAKASDRIAVLAKLNDEISIEPLVQRAIENRQQFTRIDRAYRIIGDKAKQYNLDEVWVSLMDIQGNYDYEKILGTSPQDPARAATTWMNLLQAAGQLPQLQQPGPDGRILDFRKVFNKIAERSGIEDIDRYYMTVNVVPDEEAAQQAQAGNMVPIDGSMPPEGMLPGGG